MVVLLLGQVPRAWDGAWLVFVMGFVVPANSLLCDALEA